jgi:hopanoid-associated sugar epimerase
VDGQLTLVTGVAGFLGSAVARALAARGARVRGVVRGSSSPANLADFPGELVTADLRDEAAVAGAMAGVEAVYHVAADYRIWARDPEEIVRNNLAMTGAVMRAALSADVGRVVYTSSVATLLPLDGRPSDETHPATPDQATGAYKRSKVVAERLVERMIAEQGLPAVIVNPSTPIGPRDVKPTPTGRIVVEAANGRMPAFVDSGLNLVHVDDVAQGHILAAEKGRIGERYILGGEDVSLAAMLGEIARIVGRKPPTLSLPVAPLFPLAAMAEGVAWITGREPFLTLDSLRMSRHHMFYSSAKATAELGYRARPYAEALEDAVRWFRDAGMIR